MRSAPFLLVGSISLATVLASACSESFPASDATDGGAAQSDGGLPPLESSPPAPIPPDQRKDAASSPVVFDAARGGVWTANGDVGSVSYVDVDARQRLFEIPIGKDVRSVALSPDGAWLAAVDRGGASVTLIDAEGRAARRTIALGTHPRAAVWDAADPRWLYVAVEDDDAVAVIDRTAGVLARTIAVGRLPSGLAVSRRRAELAVLHRIDGRITLVPLVPFAAPAADGAAPPNVEVPIADEPDTGDPKVPHGRPFAFESLAWGPNGDVAWVPHELLAPTHPFQFQSTLFPAVSVVDLAARAEVKTDPADPNGVVAGRKNLFAAIAIPDPTGNLSVVSQPCAAAMHPNGVVAYAVACGSEDLLTFDVTTGQAIDLLRNVPGDHPVGLTLDDTGQRAFVIADQSHTLTVIDTANGSPIGHARVVGDPIATVAKDPVDPEMRRGLTLFYRANSAKGDLATTGNDWMACGGCHLDGFVSTNIAFFEDAKIVDPTKDAQIGHVGLKDLFSTVPTPDSVQPHDIVVALRDQGGLTPDRRGEHVDQAIDPASPGDAATTMARQLARVIARDLPLGPSWFLPGDAPNADYDGKWCGQCHQAEYAAWQKSVHAHAAEDPMVFFGADLEKKKLGAQYGRLCAGCHDPTTARLGDTSMTSKRGITCLTCHDTERLIRAGGNADYEAKAHDWSVDHKERAKAGLATLRDPQFCGACHQQFVPATGLEALSTLHEWQSSRYAGVNDAPDAGRDAGDGGDGGDVSDAGALDAASDAGAVAAPTQSAGPITRCVDCHAQKIDGVADHTMIGGNVYMAQLAGDPAVIEAEKRNLRTAIALVAARDGHVVRVTVKNRGAGHSFPTGVTDVREPWVELQAVDASKQVVARYGGPGPDGLIPSGAARLGLDIANGDGTVLLLHELSETTRIPFERRVPAFGEVQLTLDAPAQLPPGTTLQAVLFYRNVRTTYYRAATGDSAGSAPEVEVARVNVP